MGKEMFCPFDGVIFSKWVPVTDGHQEDTNNLNVRASVALHCYIATLGAFGGAETSLLAFRRYRIIGVILTAILEANRTDLSTNNGH